MKTKKKKIKLYDLKGIIDKHLQKETVEIFESLSIEDAVSIKQIFEECCKSWMDYLLLHLYNNYKDKLDLQAWFETACLYWNEEAMKTLISDCWNRLNLDSLDSWIKVCTENILEVKRAREASDYCRRIHF